MFEDPDFKESERFEDFFNTIEGNKHFHSLYLKAINNPFRRKILKIINKEDKISKEDLFKQLKDIYNISDNNVLKYNIDYLISAFCIETTNINDIIYYQITKAGKVIEFID
ncbi:MAG: hypothetical protein KGD57_09085 [Candidatus Lokiarchaeota archaeon]|nr:hypothetical protein [Candidatus Lokiarchaeota archaeon]